MGQRRGSAAREAEKVYSCANICCTKRIVSSVMCVSKQEAYEEWWMRDSRCHNNDTRHSRFFFPVVPNKRRGRVSRVCICHEMMEGQMALGKEEDTV